MTDFQPMNLPITFTTPDIVQEVGAPAQEVRRPTSALSLENTVYSALGEGPTATAARWLDINVVMPYITDRDRPKLDQTKVDQLWAGSGIPDKAPDASKYNDVAVYTLLDAAKRRQAMREVDEETQLGAGSIVRGAALLGASMLDPINLATGLFPAGAAFKAIGLSKAAASVAALEVAGKTGATLSSRVGARFATGAIEGAIGNIPLEAVTQPMRSSMGEDYSALDSLKNVALGGVIGGGLHVAIGGLSSRGGAKIGSEIDGKMNEFIQTVPEVERANFIQDGKLTDSGIQSFMDYQISNKFGGNNLGQLDQGLRLKLLDASQDFNGFNNETIASEISLKQNFNDAIDLIANPENRAAMENAAPETHAIANWISEATTTPRMVNQVLNNYNDRVTKLAGDSNLSAINKNQILREEIAKTQPTAAELVSVVSPQTRENAITMATAQLEDGKYPTVDAMVMADKSIGKASTEDIKLEMSRMDDLENSYVTDKVPPMPEKTKEIPFENNVDYEAGIAEVRARQIQTEELSKLGLYSKSEKARSADVEPLSSIKMVQDQIVKNFGKDGQKLLDVGKLEVVDSVVDLPGGPHPDGAKGLTIIGGKAYLVARNLSLEQVKNITLHEVGVHANMHNMLGKDGFNTLIKQMKNFIKKTPRLSEILDNVLPKDTPVEHIDEETLAYLVENMQDSSLIKNLISKVKAWVFKTFPSLRESLTLNDNDIAALALTSLRNYANDSSVERAGKGHFYSIAENLIEQSENEIEVQNKILLQSDHLRSKLLNDAEVVTDIGDVNTFTDYIRTELTSIDTDTATIIFKDLGNALNRANEQALPNPAAYAVKFTMDKLQYGLEAHKLALIHDRAVKKRLGEYLKRNWTGREEYGIRSLLIGTSHNADGARANTSGDAIRNNKRMWTGNLDTGLKKLGIDELFYKGSLNDDMTRAMWLLEDGGDVSKLQVEAVKAAQHVLNLYDGMNQSMRDNGMMINKIPHYLANQQSLHNQTKIIAAGYENWKTKMLTLLDMDKTAEAMNVRPSQINDEMLRAIYDGFATGEHIGNSGNVAGGAPTPSPFGAIRQKPRKLIFKDADSVIEYRNAYGDTDFQAAIISTIEANSKKLGLLQTLGVNYERNLKELAKEFVNAASTPEQRMKLRNFADNNMLNMLKSIDGRADRPFSESWSRFGSNFRAIMSLTKLGGASLSAITDLSNMAGHLNQKGMGGIIYNLFTQGFKTFTKFSPERKQMIGSMGVFADSVLQNAYRDGNADISTGKTLSKWTHRFFSMTGLDAWTNSTRLAAADSLMNHMSGFTKDTFDKLPASLQRNLKQFDINEDEWNLLRQTNQRQVDGNSYLVADEISNIRAQIEASLAGKGATGKVLEVATDRYIANLKNKLINFYHDGLSHMVIEPDAATKYYQTWGGLNPGSAGGEIAKYAMQFKSFSVGFMRKVLFDRIYENHDKFWGRNGFLADMSAEGLQQKMNMGKYIAATWIMGYAAMSLKDLSKGKEPRQFLDDNGDVNKSTFVAAMLQGGGLGIFGDFVFGDFNRFGGSAIETAAGPAAGVAASGLGLLAAYRDYFTGETDKDPYAKTLRLAADNTPFINAFYLRTGLNYLFFNGMQEYLNPGYLRRMEKNVQKQNNQEFWLPPTNSVQY